MKATLHWAAALTLTCAGALYGCGDDAPDGRPRSRDSAKTGEAGVDAGDDDDDEDKDDGKSDAGRRDARGDAATAMGDAGAGSGSGSGSGGGNGSGGGGNGSGGGGSGSGGGGGSGGGSSKDGGMSSGDGGAAGGGSDCEAKAKEECEYQKKCDPFHFARDWDGDINQFCIPKRKLACEKNEPMTGALAISAACNTWVHASCDNHRNFYFRVYDSNMKWQYGDAACEVEATVKRGDKSDGNDCRSDYECKAGLFCKTANDDYQMHGMASAEAICGKCAPQLGYEGPNTGNGYMNSDQYCYRQEQCKVGYTCLSVYGADPDFRSLSWSNIGPKTDFQFCVKNMVKAGMDKDCAKGSNAQCDTGLVCETMDGSTIGKCKPANGATVDSYVGKDARCMPALCDPRQHLTCKPVQTGSTTENRCVPDSIAPIGGYCKNDKKESVADCSVYARCNDASGQCTRRNVETESCFPTSATPVPFDVGSCDPKVFGYESWLVCRQDDGELSPHCHKGQPQIMCSLQ